MAWTAADIPDLTGKVAVVTGANGGIGLETTRELARKGATVVMGVRNLEKAESAHADLVADIPGAQLQVRPLDLASLAAVEEFAAGVLAEHQTTDILVNNAGVMGIPRYETTDGFEMQLGTNHLGHFVVTARLMPALLRAEAGRVVTVTSVARHFGSPVDETDPHMKQDYDGWRSYARSKLANLHFAIELNRRLQAAQAPAASLAAHPGYTNSDLQATSAAMNPSRPASSLYASTVRWAGMSCSRGALPQLRAATDPDARGGELYTPRWVVAGVPVGRPLLNRSTRSADLESLWMVSERETGVAFDVAAQVKESAA